MSASCGWASPRGFSCELHRLRVAQGRRRRVHARGFIARSSPPPGVARRRMYNGSAVHADLERVIALQRLDTAAEAARRKLADEPEHEKALDARLEAATQRGATAQARLAGDQNTPRANAKELPVPQGPLPQVREPAE